MCWVRCHGVLSDNLACCHADLSAVWRAVLCGMQDRAIREGLTFVAPYDDPHTIAGQGTIGDEILRQVITAL
jgi:hypothetical protein